MISLARRWRVLTIGASIAFAGTLLAAPVAAQTDTTTTFEVTAAGDLTITAPDAAHLGTVAGDGQLSGDMGAITVTDDRTDLFRSWDVFVKAEGGFAASIVDEAGESQTYTIKPSQVTYNPNAGEGFVGNLLNADVTLGSARTLDSADPVLQFTSVLDLGLSTGDVSWTPAITLDAAGENIPTGTYSGTITHSVVQ